MSKIAANLLRRQANAVMQHWDDRVRSEIPAARDQEHVVLRNSLPEMLEVLAKILGGETDPKTAPEDLALITGHGSERAFQEDYTLEQMIEECQIFQEVVFEELEHSTELTAQDRGIVFRYIGDLIRQAAGEYARVKAEQARAASEGVRRSEDRYRTLFNSIDEGFCVIEVLFDNANRPIDYRFLEANPAFEVHTGLRGVVGKRMRELVPGHEEYWFQTYGQVALTGESIRFENAAKALNDRWYDVFAFPVGEPGSRKVAVLFVDIAERKRAEEALRKNQERLSQALHMAHMATWDWDPETNETVASDSMSEVLGLRPGDTLAGSAYNFRLVHPDDVGRYRALVKQAMECGEGWHLDFRIIRPRDGEVAWLEERATPTRDPDTGKTHVTGLIWNVTERKRAEEALREADRAKSEFLAMLGHELRNPLGAASNAMRLVHAHGGNVPSLSRPVLVLERQLAQMTRLVDDLLDVTRITQGKVHLEKRAVALDDVVAAALRSLQPQIHEKGLRFRFEGDPEAVVLGDTLRLEQVVTNLAGNAVKYTEEGVVYVSVRKKGDVAELRVRDTGIGISPEKMPYIFDLFSQARSDLARSQGGLGIGLTVVKQMVEQHGGRVRAESRGLGHGSTFVVTLPLADGRPVSPAADTPEAFGAAESSTDHHLRVLVVDDNHDAAESLADILGTWGHDTRMVHDGLAAVESVMAERPDVALVDIGLPGMDGYEVARRIRSEPGFEAMTLVAVTGYGQAEDQDRALAAGFDYHVVKPIDFDALERLLGGGPP